MIEIQLEQLLKKRGVTLYWLSKEMNVRYATLWSLANRDLKKIDLDLADRICEVLECEVGDLLVRVESTKRQRKQSGPRQR